MNIDSSRIQDLINRPGESLTVELKRWIDPSSPEGISKIVRAALALRNHGGGYLVIGFDDKTLLPDKQNIPADVRSSFHTDKIQAVVSRFSSEPFEVFVEFPEREGQAHPVIVVPPGVKTPVASKSDLSKDGKPLIAQNDIYVRSLSSNNTPSTTKANWKDWPRIVETCFDNREADIGRFLRRHLTSTKSDLIHELLISAHSNTDGESSAIDHLKNYLKEGEDRYKHVINERSIELPEHGTWEVAMLILGEIPQHSANTRFLNLIHANNPEYTGWPIWLDSRGFHDESMRPYVVNGAWETLIVSGPHVDFMQIDPQGRFYLRRALQDDFSGRTPPLKPLSVLDFGLPVIRTAEAIAVGLAFAKAMGASTDDNILAFSFRWTRLRGRELSSWAQPGRYVSPGRRAYQDDLTTFVNVPFDAPLSTLGEYVNEVVQPLYEIFDGFSLSKDIVEDLTRRLIERRL